MSKGFSDLKLICLVVVAVGSGLVGLEQHASAVNFSKAKITIRNESSHDLVAVVPTKYSSEGNAVFDGHWVVEPPQVIHPNDVIDINIEGKSTAPLRFIIQFRTAKSKNDELRIVGVTSPRLGDSSLNVRGIGKLSAVRKTYDPRDYSTTAEVVVRDKVI